MRLKNEHIAIIVFGGILVFGILGVIVIDNIQNKYCTEEFPMLMSGRNHCCKNAAVKNPGDSELCIKIERNPENTTEVE